jgi:hypothetical protein
MVEAQPIQNRTSSISVVPKIVQPTKAHPCMYDDVTPFDLGSNLAASCKV